MAITDFFGFHENQESISVGKIFGVNQNVSLTLEVDGNATGFTIIPEGIVNAKTEDWSPLSSIAYNGYIIKEAITQNGIYALDITGLYKVRFNLTNIDSGKISVTGRVAK